MLETDFRALQHGIAVPEWRGAGNSGIFVQIKEVTIKMNFQRLNKDFNKLQYKFQNVMAHHGPFKCRQAK